VLWEGVIKQSHCVAYLSVKRHGIHCLLISLCTDMPEKTAEKLHKKRGKKLDCLEFSAENVLHTYH
jgi:hypothetical protein